MKKTLLLAIAVPAFMAVPMIASAVGVGGIIGDCVDCHTMHNSQQGMPVAKAGLGGGALTTTPLANLLKLDCVACHANGAATSVITLGSNTSQVPQVMHTGASDLAGGNFQNIVSGGNRKGHNVVDLVSAEPYMGKQTFAVPPGKYRMETHGAANYSVSGGTGGIFGNATAFTKLTCAGNAGCHGVRNQVQSYSNLANGSVNAATIVRLQGIPAITGAHHANFDGVKNPAQNTVGHIGAPVANNATVAGNEVANGYRFIPGLKGVGNTVGVTAVSSGDRWKNASPTSHNEYYGSTTTLGSSCGGCHVNATTELSSHLGYDSKLIVPNQSMSGFCTTCHGSFHSSGASNPLSGGQADVQLGAPAGGAGKGGNGVSGAFLRHPSDYVIPNTGEYAAYTSYKLSAPVARQVLPANGTSSTVAPSSDMVMCLSCHAAHATANDYMLRFNYADQQAGNAGAGLGEGCLACHTTKGVLK